MLILPIGDAHISAEDDLERFKYLSKFIVDKKPDVICFMGDFLTMDALNFFDKDKRKKLEGKRYKKEIDKGNETLDIIFFDLLELQEKLRQQKLKIYKPEIYYLEGNHECVSEDTEILTSNGWKLSKDIDYIDYIASFDILTHQIEYNNPLCIKKDIDAKMYGVYGNLSDELVSNNHNIVLDGDLVRVDSCGGRIKQSRFLYSGYGEEKDIGIDENWLRVLIWTICDGTIVDNSKYNKNSSKVRIQFKLSKQRKIDRLIEVLNSCGIKYTFKECKKSVINKLQPYYIRIYSDDAKKIFNLLNGKKEIPDNWLFLDHFLKKKLIEELPHTDGSNIFNHIGLSTVSQHDANLLQLICITGGVPCRIDEKVNRSGFKNGKLQYRLSIFDNGVFDRNYVLIENKNIINNVVAIQTKNNTLITRRNGKVNFTGNCRIKRYLDIDPTFEGLIGIEQDLKLKERNIKFIPYREYLDLNGIAFTHIPFNKCKEISGVNITRKISQVLYTSCVFAHVHSMEFENFKRHGQEDLQQILSVGCYFEKHEDYVHGRITEYWKGLVLLDSFKPGRFDIQTFSLETLKRKYNG